jgi:hypothetical protein
VQAASERIRGSEQLDRRQRRNDREDGAATIKLPSPPTSPLYHY